MLESEIRAFLSYVLSSPHGQICGVSTKGSVMLLQMFLCLRRANNEIVLEQYGQ